MTTKVRTAAATILTLTALAGTGILAHEGVAAPRETKQSVTSPADEYSRAFESLKTTTTGEKK